MFVRCGRGGIVLLKESWKVVDVQFDLGVL